MDWLLRFGLGTKRDPNSECSMMLLNGLSSMALSSSSVKDFVFQTQISLHLDYIKNVQAIVHGNLIPTVYRLMPFSVTGVN